ncbi:MAG: aminotransferase class I/II-fold pyridoxal phosphate-dependent enzyme [Candidatus Aminicenantes bacterium]|nr:MAG: aminotransferase class I/II-fold pyridoxal phosphate-dependent enzyme [Candidatus Aminicenantes bacterium]
MTQYSDFRSDTVTRPTENMRKAMAAAEVGDDVLGDDPTVQKLESIAADMIGKEAAVYVPSGTMANSIAIKCWTNELDEVIVEERAHLYNMESTHMTFIARVTPRPLSSNRGAMNPEEVERNIRKPSVHIPRTSLICIENTHNNWSGAVVPMENLKAIREIADRHDVKVHFDGARVFNACHATGIPVKEYGKIGDSLMFCLSKGLSAPVGSVLTGPKDFVDYARRIRKALGGGMRQVGVLAAPGIVALTEMVDRLKEDHIRAKKLALTIQDLPGIDLNPDHIDTNIVIFGFKHPEISIPDFLEKLKERGILALATTGERIRFITHKDIDDKNLEKAISGFQEILSR